MQLPPGYYFEWGGQFENMERARRHLMIIVPITIGAIFFLLFLLFRSLRFAALIILVLPFASIGGIAALYFYRRISLGPGVGRIHRAVGHRGAEWRGAGFLHPEACARQASAQREAIHGRRQAALPPRDDDRHRRGAGLVPFLFATGPGSEVQRPLAIVVIGGLVTSTLLTLVIVPILYRWFEPHDLVPYIEDTLALSSH